MEEEKIEEQAPDFPSTEDIDDADDTGDEEEI